MCLDSEQIRKFRISPKVPNSKALRFENLNYSLKMAIDSSKRKDKQISRSFYRRSAVKKTIQNTLLALVGMTAIAEMSGLGVQAASQPANLAQLQAEFNEANGLNEADGPAFYEMGVYEKARTQFDGVTHENQVTYLVLKQDQGVEVPVLSTGRVNQNLDFTIMLWFKVDESHIDSEAEIMYIFSFEDSAACFLTKNLSLMCDSYDRKKLQIITDELIPGKWFHLTLSCQTGDGQSFLLLQDNTRQIAIAETTNFGFRQNSQYGWKACLGDCNSAFGFSGGIRELVLLNTAVRRDEARKAKNMIFVYNNSFKAYFRFQDINNKFAKDEFVDREWLRFKKGEVKQEEGQDEQEEETISYIGSDIIPNDICPSLFDQKELLRFDGKATTEDFELETVLKQEQYSYMMSMTLMVNETTCTTRNPTYAARDCNLFKLEEVFMLYFEIPNMAKFHFFAQKNYYESQTKAFFLPYDQWITIQIVFSHYGGYHMVVGDQNGKVIYNRAEEKNMHEMRPSGKMDLLRSFEGYVESFILSDMEHKLTTDFVTDFRDFKVEVKEGEEVEEGEKEGLLFNLSFLKSEILVNDVDEVMNDGAKALTVNEGLKVMNRGTEEDVALRDATAYEWIFFRAPTGRSLGGTFDYAGQLFDGIACDDKHITLRLDKKTSHLRFNTPVLTDWSAENTIEFWFKLEDDSAYTEDAMIFTMFDEAGALPYYTVYIEAGALKCAPFGETGMKDPIVTYTEFSLANKDQYGWWHISCSYSFQEEAKGTLYNTKVNQYVDVDLLGLPLYYPDDSLRASFGHSAADNGDYGVPGLLVKEFRLWNKQLSTTELLNWRSRQIDPTYLESGALLTYLRLATGSASIENFAESHPDYTFMDTSPTLKQVSFVEDYVDEEKYTYDAGLEKVVPQLIRTYHTVCPVHTYFMNQYCYSEPVNHAVLAAFPSWNTQTKALDWELTLAYSSLIDREVLQFLKPGWQADDMILQDFFDSSEATFDQAVPADLLRHESEYRVKAYLTNEQITFQKQAVINFVPSKCHWFEVVDAGVRFGQQVFQFTPGGDDIFFQLELKKNEEIECSQFMFFDAFDGVDFDYIITDSVDYLEAKPEAVFQAFDSATGAAITQQDGATPEGLRVNVTIPADEQKKLPVFQEISILMTVRWTNSKYPGMKNLTRESTFQNLLYTIKFEPLANYLVADLVASTVNVTRDEGLILDASSSYITNMPENLQLKQLAYEWTCPEGLEAVCEGQNGSQLPVSWTQVLVEGVVFEVPYAFSINVIWAKADGTVETETLTESVTWYDLVLPDFSITFEPDPVLITDDTNTLFYLEPINFDIDSIRDYDVVWTLEPELAEPTKRSILSYGKIMQIVRGAYAENTDYTVNLSVTNLKLAKLSATKTVTFRTLAPPKPGTVQVQPSSGFIGTEFTVVLREWTSDNQPITYNVYNTYDRNGSRKGGIINTDGPIPIDDVFAFEATRINPIIVAVTDSSGETLEYIMAPEIQDAAAPTDTDEIQPDDQPSPQNLLAMIQKTDSTPEKVSFMNSAIAQSLMDPLTIDSAAREEEIETQIAFRQSLFEEIEKEIHYFAKNEDSNPDMSTRDFLYETVPMIRDLTLIPDYMDQGVVDKASQVIYQLTELNEDMWAVALETDANFRDAFIESLENLNRFAHRNGAGQTHAWVRLQVEELMDKMCLFSSLPENYAYDSNGEIAFSLYRFDESTALLNRRGTIHALDVHYDYSAYTMYNWFSTMPGTLCAQVLAIREGDLYTGPNRRRMLQPGTTAYSRGVLQVSVYENGTGIRYQMGELSGQTVATFDLLPDTYRSNQTVCMAYSETRRTWDSDLCITELEVSSIQQKCTCNAFESRKVGLFTDSSRALGQPVSFPEIERSSKLYDDFETVTTAPVEIVQTLDGAGFVWVAESIFVALLCLSGALVALKFDRVDYQEQSIMKTAPTAVPKQNHFVEEVAKSLGENYAQVVYRQQSLLYYRTIFSHSPFPHMMSQMHPMIAPFTSYIATESRFMRYCMYLLQINLVTTLCFVYFGSLYRLDDPTRNEDVLDQRDMMQIIGAGVVGSLLLLPFISEPLVMLCSSKIHKSTDPVSAFATTQVQILPRNGVLKTVLIVLALVSTVAMPVWAIIQSPSVPASSQYCMSTAMIGAMFGGILVANLVYIIVITALAKKLKKDSKTGKCLPTKAIRIMKDMRAVNEVKKMFTLADVLPSSLEGSLINSRQEISQQNALLKVHMGDHNGPKTLHTDEDQGAEEDIQIVNVESPHVNKISGIVSSSGQDESQIRSMLKESQLDLDNSRNDVIPSKKSKMDIYASIHPEGYRGFSERSSVGTSNLHSRDNSNVEEDGLGPESQSETIEKGRSPAKTIVAPAGYKSPNK